MRREGSPFQGVGAVAVKELADNLSSARMFVLEWLIVLTALAALYSAIDSLRKTTAQDPFLLLRLFTVNHAPLPSFHRWDAEDKLRGLPQPPTRPYCCRHAGQWPVP